LLTFENTRIFNSNFSSSLVYFYNQRELYEYFSPPDANFSRFGNLREFNIREQRYGAKLLFGTQLDKNGSLFSELRHEYQRVYKINDANIPDYKSFTTIKFGILIDNQEQSGFPRSGRVIDLSLESSIFSDSKVDGFSKATFYYHNNLTIGSLTLRPSLMFGVADGTLPFLEFFNIGGEGSFFGLREEEERGRQIIKGSMNYYYKLPFDLFFDTYIYGRYDVGAIWLLPEEIRISNLRHGFGSGLAFDTPLGPARFSAGKSWYFTENPNSVIWGPTEFYFVIGINL
jgi:NTE family protein